MQKLRFSTVIQAPRNEVWEAMLGDEGYRTWTAAFGPGSHYVGDWNQGSEILFLAPGEGGKMMGMVSRIKESRPQEYVSIEHLGVFEDGKKDTSSAAAQGWAGNLENYTLRDKDGGTEVVVELDTADEYKEMFEGTWPNALQKLKELAEHR